MKKTNRIIDILLSIFIVIALLQSCNKIKPVKERDFIVFNTDSLIANETWWIKSDYDEYNRSLVYTANDNVRQLFKDCTQCELLFDDSIQNGHLTFFLLDSNINPIDILNYE